jgi:hypothetical protein
MAVDDLVVAVPGELEAEVGLFGDGGSVPLVLHPCREIKQGTQMHADDADYADRNQQ